MVIFPWLVLVALALLMATGLIGLVTCGMSRLRGRPMARLGWLATVLVALPILMAIVAWGLLLKPR